MAYAVVRAITVSFSWDEAFTYMNHVRWDLLWIKDYEISSANHHLLNVWGMWICSKLFGPQELSLRLTNLLSFAFYLYAACRISLRAGSTVLTLSAFVLLTVHPYLLDFFSLARGYGLSNGLMLFSLWQLQRFASEKAGARPALLCAISAALAALAHTMLLNYLLCVLAIIIGLWFVLAVRGERKLAWKPLFALGAIATLCIGVVVINAMGMYNINALFHGSAGPWRGMMGSLAEFLCYHRRLPMEPLTLMSIFLALVATSSIASLIAWYRGGRSALLVLLGLLLLIGVLLALYFQHVLMDLPWPRTRTGLFLLPLLCWLLVSALVALDRPSRFVRILGAGLSCVLLVHFANCANTTYALEWKESGEVKRFIEVINKDRLALDAKRPIVSVGCGAQCSPAFNYTTRAYDMHWLVGTDQPVHDSLLRCEYQLVAFDAEQWVEKPYMTLLDRSESTGTALYRDERVHRPFAVPVHEAVVRAMDADTIVRDGIPLPRLSWIVPKDWDGGSVLVTGTAQALEPGRRNWLTLYVEQIRDSVAIDHADHASHHQVLQYGEWYQAGILFQPKRALLPGDEIRFSVIPFVREPRIHIGEVQLHVMR